MRAQFTTFFSEADWRANARLEEKIGQLREDIAPTWLEEPLSIEETAERYVGRRSARYSWSCARGRWGRYLDRFEFRSDLLEAMRRDRRLQRALRHLGHAEAEMNFLVHSMCRLPGADGTWMIVGGGMARSRPGWRSWRGAGARSVSTSEGVAHRGGRGRGRGSSLRLGAGAAHGSGGGELRSVPDARPWWGRRFPRRGTRGWRATGGPGRRSR